MDNKVFVNTLAGEIGRDAKDVATLVEGLSVIFREKCSGMDSIAIPGFGTFQPVKKDETIIVDETSGKRTLLPPSITLEFKPSALMKKHLTD